jgi:PAS domain S-box-containing protein
MTARPSIRAEILGKLLLIQATLDVLSDNAGIAAFLRRSLSGIPGVVDVHIFVGGEVFPPSREFDEIGARCEAAWRTSGACPEQTIGVARVTCIPLRTVHQLYGLLILSLDDEEAFSLYRDFIRNIANVVATTFETRDHVRQLDEARAALEIQVTERTATLKESQEKFRALVETTSDWVWEVDAVGTYTYASPKVEALLGFKPEEVIGKSPFDFMPPEEAQRVASAFLDASRAARPLEQVLNTNLHKDGHAVTMETSGTPMFDALGNVVGYRGIDRDVTARERNQEALRESENKFRQVSASAQDAIIILDEDGAITDWNVAAGRIFGYAAAEVIGRDAHSLLAPARQRSAFQEGLQQFRQSGTGPVVNKTLEVAALRRDGTEFPAELSISSMRLRGQWHAIGIVRDITQRKRAEEEHRAAALYARSLIEASVDPLVIISPLGKITDVNQATEQATGVPRDTLIGDDFSDHFTDPAKARAAYQQALQDGVVRDLSLTMRNVSGRTTEVAYNAAVYRNAAGDVEGVFAAARDVSERNQLQSQFLQAQKMESVGRLAGGVAHDFNNMLTAILGYVELSVLRLGASHEVTPHIEEIRKAAERSAALTRQLLAFARREAIELKVLNLNQATESILKMLRRLLGENVTLVWTPGNALWNVKADAAQIDQVLANLSVNARDAMTGHDARLEIETSNVVLDAGFVASHPGAVPGEFVLLRVADNGCGMDAHTLALIFEPFFTTKARGVGTGLGMSTVYGIMKQHNGFIDVESTLGVGTTVHLYFPRTTEVAKAAEASPVRAIRRGGETVLLVDDEECVRTSIGEMLRHLGYQVLLAPGGTEAVALAARHTGGIDLVLTDVIMPGMNGMALRDELRKLFPDVAVLFMSGYADEVISTLGVLEAGINFMQKPITLRILSDAVRSSLDTPTSMALKFALVPGWKV